MSKKIYSFCLYNFLADAYNIYARYSYYPVTRTLDKEQRRFRQYSATSTIVRSSEVAVMAASRRKIIPRLECARVNLIPQVIG